MFKPVRTNLGQQVFQHLLALIYKMEIEPGAPLGVSEIAEQLGVSRSPVRDAMLMLIAEGVVEQISCNLDGSDAMYPDPDFSSAYVILKTDHPEGLEGHGLLFTIGRSNEVCVAPINAFASHVSDKTLESLTENVGDFWRSLTGDIQLRWIGPEKGAIHVGKAWAS